MGIRTWCIHEPLHEFMSLVAFVPSCARDDRVPARAEGNHLLSSVHLCAWGTIRTVAFSSEPVCCQRRKSLRQGWKEASCSALSSSVSKGLKDSLMERIVTSLTCDVLCGIWSARFEVSVIVLPYLFSTSFIVCCLGTYFAGQRRNKSILKSINQFAFWFWRMASECTSNIHTGRPCTGLFLYTQGNLQVCIKMLKLKKNGLTSQVEITDRVIES